MSSLSVFDVNYTPTADFVMSASDDGNVRIWKRNASAKMGPVSTKERQAIEYRQSLVERWSTVKDVRSVKERRHVPASIHNAVAIKRDMIESRKVKEDRRRKHTRAGQDKPKAERKSESVGASLDRTRINENRRSCHCRAEVVFGPRSVGPVNSDTNSDSITPYDHLMNLTLTHAPGFGLFGRMRIGAGEGRSRWMLWLALQPMCRDCCPMGLRALALSSLSIMPLCLNLG